MRWVMAFVALFWAIGLSVAAMMTPPEGEIDSSVLILLAQIIVFVATLTGISLPEFFDKINRKSTRSK